MGLLTARRAFAVSVLISTGDEAAFTGAYDDYESRLAHVYEPARRTLTSYEGDLIRLRRDSDDAESDFGYDSDGNLDTAAISTWLGGASGYGVTFYDQVGGDDVTQATNAAQPLYVPNLQNGHPGFRFDGSDDYLQGAFTNGGALSQPFNVFSVAKLDEAAVNDDSDVYLLDGDDNSGRMMLVTNSSETPDAWAIYAGSFLNGNIADSDWNLWSVLFGGVSSQFWLNQSSEASGNAGGDNSDGITIGARFLIKAFWDGDIAVPAIIADPALSAADRSGLETVINAYWGIF
jgi:hypothetical protein